jgi:hypothetical protein
VLDFCIFRKDHYRDVIVPRIQDFKFRYFGHDIVVLHEHDIRKQEAPFVFLKSEPKRTAFMDDLNQIISEADFTVVAVVVDKQKLTSRYARPANPYDLALCFCMERSFAFLKDRDQHRKTTHIVVEKRGKREDNELELAFRRIRDGGNNWGPMSNFDILFADKRTNSAGLQLADLTARPIGRNTLNPQQPNRAFDIINTKFRRSPSGIVKGWGLKTFP